MVVSRNALASVTQTLPTDDSELYSLAHNNEPKSHLVTRRKRKSSFDLKRFYKVLHIDPLVTICSSLRDLRTPQAVSLRIPKRSCKIVETGYHVKSLMLRYFFHPNSPIRVYQIQNFLTHFFLRWHPVGVQTWLHLLKTFHRV